MNNVFFATLGCSKNEVDTAMMKGLLREDSYRVTLNALEADIIFVNTCGFIDAAKEESIDRILELATLKERGSCKYLLLTGCLAQRYPEELRQEIPEVDGILGPGYMNGINEFLDEILLRKHPIWTKRLEMEYMEGARRETGAVTEYVKISEGCNNRCTYCIIPKLRGNNRSRRLPDIVEEVERLVASGTREIILIAQNTTDFGVDTDGKFLLAKLLDRLNSIPDLHWIRVMYAYPDHFTDELIKSFKKNEKVLPYIDMPLQHGVNRILKKMNRKTSKEDILSLVERLRQELPNIVLRSTFILGFPGETEEDFQELLEFIQLLNFDRVGAFTYSQEEGTPAAEFDEQIPEEIKEERLRRFMEMQGSISERKLEEKIGEILEVLVEEFVEEKMYAGRSYLDAPEIDGVVYIHSNLDLKPGSFVKVRITDSLEHDLIGEIV